MSPAKDVLVALLALGVLFTGWSARHAQRHNDHEAANGGKIMCCYLLIAVALAVLA